MNGVIVTAMAVADTTIRKTVALPRETGERLARMAEREGVTEAAILRSVIEAGLMGYETADDVFERLNAAAAQGSDALTLELFRLREHPLFLGTFGSGEATFVRLKGDIMLEHHRGTAEWSARHINHSDLDMIRQLEDALVKFRAVRTVREEAEAVNLPKKPDARGSSVRRYSRKAGNKPPPLPPNDDKQ